MMSKSVQRFEWIELIEKQARTFLEQIESFTDEDLEEKYQQARKLGHVAWVIECSVLAEKLARAVQQRRGRGNVDTAEEGRLAVARKIAGEAGVTPKSVFRAEKIYQTFFDLKIVDNVVHNLERAKTLGKSCFLLAAETDDPRGFIEKFDQEKVYNPNFRTRHAKRIISEDQAPPINEVITAGIDSEQKLSVWQNYRTAAHDMKYHFPALRIVIREHLEALEAELTQPSESIRSAILRWIRDGANTREDLADALKKPREFVRVWLDRMVQVGDLERKEKERAEGARGAATPLYFVRENKSRA
jgi:hypothetical protein